MKKIIHVVCMSILAGAVPVFAADSVPLFDAGAVGAPKAAVFDTGSGAVIDEEALCGQLAEKTFVLTAELHTVRDHHEIQESILRCMHARHPNVILGLEMFSFTDQDILDQYLFGVVTDEELEEYWNATWGHDFRLYQPILAYAREWGIPIKGLNAPKKVTGRIYREGLASLSPEERALLPETLNSITDRRYKKMVVWVAIGRGHGGLAEEILDTSHPDFPKMSDPDFEDKLVEFLERTKPPALQRFLDSQQAWNETMAQKAVEAVQGGKAPIVILAGMGHLRYKAGIAESLRRRSQLEQSVVFPFPTPQQGGNPPLESLLGYLRDPANADLLDETDFYWLLPGSPGTASLDLPRVKSLAGLSALRGKVMNISWDGASL